jgi:hypothetical protein
MTAAQRRTARRRAGLPEPTPRDADQVFTWRQQIADAEDPALRRRLISDACGGLLAAGLTREQAAARLGVGAEECRRAREAVRRASLRAARPRRDGTRNADDSTGPPGPVLRPPRRSRHETSATLRNRVRTLEAAIVMTP